MSRRPGPWLERMGPGIVQALENHPLAASLNAIALLGAGDPFLIHAGDPAVKVMVPLLGGTRADALAQAQMQMATALVLIDPREARGISDCPTVIVMSSSPAAATSGFLPTASSFDQLQAAVALTGMPALSRAIATARPNALDAPITAAHVADAIIEAIVASGGHS